MTRDPERKTKQTNIMSMILWVKSWPWSNSVKCLNTWIAKVGSNSKSWQQLATFYDHIHNDVISQHEPAGPTSQTFEEQYILLFMCQIKTTSKHKYHIKQNKHTYTACIASKSTFSSSACTSTRALIWLFFFYNHTLLNKVLLKVCKNFHVYNSE